MSDIPFSCIDCGQFHCDPTVCSPNSRYPSGCLTTELDDAAVADLLDIYTEEENHRVMTAAAETEAEGYGRLTRVEEIMEFARKLGMKKIGIATCAGLVQEAKIFAKILRAHGFEPFGVVCKVGSIEKTRAGLPEHCMAVGPAMCNPIYQAKKLNEMGTELNVIVGLCVGHDSLFIKYSDALVTTLVTKDRVLAHNPAAALYTSNCYYKRLMQAPNVD